MTDEITPLAVVTDNGPWSKSAEFARFVAGRPELIPRAHQETKRSPQTSG